MQYAVTVTNRSASVRYYGKNARVPNNTVAPWIYTNLRLGSPRCDGNYGVPCAAGSTIRWSTVGISAGQSVTVTFAALFDSVSLPPNGTVLHAVTSAAGTNGTTDSASTAIDV